MTDFRFCAWKSPVVHCSSTTAHNHLKCDDGAYMCIKLLMFNNYDTHNVSPIHKTLKFQKVQDIYKLELAKFMNTRVD